MLLDVSYLVVVNVSLLALDTVIITNKASWLAFVNVAEHGISSTCTPSIVKSGSRIEFETADKTNWTMHL